MFEKTAHQFAEVEGQHAEARALWHEALPLAEAMGDRVIAANSCAGLAQLAATAGDLDEAAAHWRRALGSSALTVLCLTGIAGLLKLQQRFEPALQLLAVSDQLRQAVEQNPLLAPQFRAIFTPTLSAMQAALDPDTFAQAWAAGQAMSLDQATDLALAELASSAAGANRVNAAS